jgi:hypothetical protein
LGAVTAGQPASRSKARIGRMVMTIAMSTARAAGAAWRFAEFATTRR